MQKQNRKRQVLPFWVLLPLLIGISTLACTLAESSAPPTLIPRQTAEPIPTIGYVTPSPLELPDSASPPAPTAGAKTDGGLTSMMNEVEVDRMMAHVRAMEGFYTRHVNSPQDRDDFGIGAATRYINRQFEEIQAQSQGALYVFPHEFTIEWDGVRTRQTNVVAIISGTEVGAGTIILGAHYDSRGDDDRDTLGYAPGANDNATGVAALIEMARIMAKRPHRSTLIFVAFSAEEIGRKGSIAFVNDYVKRNNIDLLAYINVDAIGSQVFADGTVSDRQIRVFSQGPNDDSRSRQIARMTNLIAFNYVPSMEVVVQDAIDRPGRYGDHFSFEEAGYPSVRFIEMAENYAYADTSDTLDGVHAGYFQRSTQAILAITSAMANGPRPPQNIALRDNGDGTRTLIWAEVPDAAAYVVALRRPDAMIYQQFETAETSIVWDGFTAQNFASIAIAAKDANGLMGPLSDEIIVPQ